MSDNIRILRNYLLYFLTFFLVCIVGISGVFADERLDTSTWINTTGRTWSISGQEYHSGGLTSDNAWTKSYYNIPSGIYTPPASYDYITWAYFQHNGGYNPCSGGNYRVNFSIKFSVPSFVNYVSNLKFEDNNCTIVKDTSTGIIQANCLINYRSTSGIYIIADFNEISGNTSSDWYISRYIDSSCDMNSGAIIENNTQNTQNIINNNNQNTENIINNQNENTEKEIESQKVCSHYQTTLNDIYLNHAYLKSNGDTEENPGLAFGITNYLELSSSLTISNIPNASVASYCFYKSDKTLISCSTFGDTPEGSVVSLPNDTKYFRGTISNVNNKPIYSFSVCQNGNQALNDSITDLNDSLNDDDSSGATSEASEFFSSFTTNTFGLTSIITAPLNLIQSLSSSSCSELHLPMPYLNNKYLDLPCMTTIYQTHFGAFFTMYQTITYGIIAYWVCVRIFNQVKDFKNPEHDEIEVVDL